jgi:hypothetical protein
MLLGDGASALAHAGTTSINEAVTLDVDVVERLADDVKIIGRPRWPDHPPEG